MQHFQSVCLAASNGGNRTLRARAAIYNEQLGLPAALDEGHRARRP